MDDKIIYRELKHERFNETDIRIYVVTQHGGVNSYLQIGDNHYITLGPDWDGYGRARDTLIRASAMSKPQPDAVQSVQHRALVRLAQLGADWDYNWAVVDRVLSLVGLKIKLPDVECWRAYDDWEEVLADLK